MDDFDPNSLQLEQALSFLRESIQPVEKTETVPLQNGLERVLAKDYFSNINVPAHNNSAMDGYAFNSDDLNNTSTTNLLMVGKSFAGKPFSGPLKSGECVRIMTGAVLPDGVDTVVMQEHTEQSDKQIIITTPPNPGDNIRQAGEDIKKGGLILKKGQRLTPADLGLLASIGVDSIEVSCPLQVALFSTGDELALPGGSLGKGQIYDSNRYTLHGMLAQIGATIVDMGIIPDTPEAIKTALISASQSADAIITSGGVSVGEADYVKSVLDEIGKIAFWKLAIKPGRPLAFGHVNNCLFFGLPGNPVSSMVTFSQIVRPALQQLAGQRPSAPFQSRMTSLSTLKKRPGRIDFQRGIIVQQENGEYAVKSTGEQGSGILSSMSKANCYIVLPIDSEGVTKGEKVTVQPFFG